MPKAKERTSDFGARLTELRKAAGYTQVELAAALGTTQRMIAYYESRAEKAPAALLPQMAAALMRAPMNYSASSRSKRGRSPIRNCIDACNGSRSWTRRPSARLPSYSIPS